MGTELGDLIRRKRKTKSWTQTQLADQLGVQQVAVSDWETGKSQPRNLDAVIKALKIKPDEYRAAFAALTESDPVVRELWATSKVSAQVRDALLTLYREAAQAHQQKTNET